ncbi:MAG TPA: pseudouridine-5'-phosphate glycosidase [Pyrinomonadaceae bacterium]|nr:pseudouridine-5'-phosphate glycosidase [Pyrinomonadaceae bacterium]
MNSDLFIIDTEVEQALADGRCVVALESTVIAHGLPRPQNLETALRLEQIVREAGAVPATIAIIEGKLHVGLTREEVERIATSDRVHKISRRDLAIAVARKLDGATTVAATMWVAHRAGLEVFATGGIGGVHRGRLPDVSADLPELAQTPMTVVCSGAKIVLDLEATREWLETYGVTVIGMGCDQMPAFYSRKSGLPVDVRADSAEEAAKIIGASRKLQLKGATLVTVPVPEEAEVPASQLESVLDEAMAEAERTNIKGRDLTPFLLSRMAWQSGGATLKANIALLENNASVAAEIALCLLRI